MDTLKSLAVVSLLGAVLYGVYVVASKPDKPLTPEMAERMDDVGPLELEQGTRDSPGVSAAQGDTSSHRLEPPRFESSAEPSSPNARLVGFDRPEEARRPSPYDSAQAARDSASEFSPAGDSTAYGSSSELSSSLPTGSSTPYSPAGSAAPAPLDTADLPLNQSPTPSPGISAVPSTSTSPPPPLDIEASKLRVRRYAFQQTWQTAREQVEQDRYREALLALTAFYNDPALEPREHEELIGWLDALAAKVVYSTEHLMTDAYVVHRNESLYTISMKYQVPYLLLKNINSVRDPELLIPGTKLKVVPGPFRAEVDLSRNEITLFVQNLYAGRFPFTRGSQPVRPGNYHVNQKDHRKEYVGPSGRIPANDPRNPFGGVWIDLGNDVCLHGSAGEAYDDPSLTCISLAQRDAEDLFAILTERESVVVIKE